jgi:hypothetical protein
MPRLSRFRYGLGHHLQPWPLQPADEPPLKMPRILPVEVVSAWLLVAGASLHYAVSNHQDAVADCFEEVSERASRLSVIVEKVRACFFPSLIRRATRSGRARLV